MTTVEYVKPGDYKEVPLKYAGIEIGTANVEIQEDMTFKITCNIQDPVAQAYFQEQPRQYSMSLTKDGEVTEVEQLPSQGKNVE